MYEQLAKQYDLINIILFGSFLTDEFHEASDIDIAVLGEEPLDLTQLLNLELAFEKHFNRSIDVVDLKGKNTDLFVKINILNTGKSVYSIDDNKSLEAFIEEVENYYRLNETYFYFRKRDALC